MPENHFLLVNIFWNDGLFQSEAFDSQLPPPLQLTACMCRKQQHATTACSLNPNQIDVPFSRGCCPDANLILQCACEKKIFCGSTELNLFPLWGTRKGERRQRGGGNRGDISLPLLSNWSFLLLPWVDCFFLVSHEHSCSAALTMAAVRHPCMRSRAVLTGPAGYFNVGGLWRLDIPGQGVSCVRTSPPHQLDNGVIVLTCSLHPASRYCAIVCAMIQIPN